MTTAFTVLGEAEAFVAVVMRSASRWLALEIAADKEAEKIKPHPMSHRPR